MYSGHHRRQATTLAIALNCLLFAACASSSDDSAAAPTAAPTTAADTTVADTSGTPAEMPAGAIIVQAPAPKGNGVFVLAADGTLGAQLDHVDESGKHGDWSPDGQTIVFSTDPSGQLWTMNADGTNPQQLLVCDEGCFFLDYPAYSPDGTRLVYTRYEPPTGDGPPSASSIRVLDLATGTSTEVASAVQPELVDVARWSPDGTQLVIGIDVFDADFNETGSTIGIVPATGGEVRRLLDTSTYAYAPDWSIDGSIVYSTETIGYRGSARPGDETWNLWTIQPDGTAATMVTDVDTGVQLLQPSWSPDGTAIIATQQSAGGESSRRTVSVDLATGSLTQVSTELATHPRMRPPG